MNQPDTREERPVDPQDVASPRPRAEAIGRILFLLGAGVLLATMVSCACNPR